MYSNAHHLDGRIPKRLVSNIYPPLGRKAGGLAKRLVAVRLWHDRGEHYEIHDYHHYQEQALKVVFEARREYERERKREQRTGKKALPKPELLLALAADVPDNVPDKSHGTNGAVPSVTRAVPGPIRPDPNRTEPTPPPSLSASEEPDGSSLMDDAEADMIARRVHTRFVRLYEARFRNVPAMGGRNVAGFGPALMRTAKLRGVAPFALLEIAFQRWANGPQDDIAKRAPYASFIARFGSLIDTEQHTSSEKDRLLAAQEAALRAGDRETYTQLVAEYRAKFGGGDNGPQPSV
jgi:hypothetical protein